MLNITEKGKFIDIKNLPSTFEIPIENIFDYKKTIAIASQQKTEETNSEQKKKPFTYEELDLNESSAAIKFNSEGNSLLININGPRECKYRDKMKNECCIVEVYSKFNTETKKESNLNSPIISTNYYSYNRLFKILNTFFLESLIIKR